jgi:hypothetical protein
MITKGLANDLCLHPCSNNAALLVISTNLHEETLDIFADKTIIFSKHEVFKVVVMVTHNFLRIFLQMKNLLKISLLITKLSISQTYISLVCKVRNISFNLR